MIMNEKFYHSINWGPWLGAAFLLSGFFFSTISNNYLLFFLIALSFTPAVAVMLLLRRYSIFTPEQTLTDYYQRATGDKMIETIDLSETQTARWIGKSVILTQTDGTTKAQRFKKSEEFIEQLRLSSPNISVITY